MPTTTLAQVDPEVEPYFDNVLLDREEPAYPHALFGQERKLPTKNSNTVIFRRYNNLADALTKLTEGITPASEQVSKFDITTKVAQYGKVIELSDEVSIAVQDETSNEVADMLVQNRDSTFDKVVRNMLDATATQLDAIHGTNLLAPTEVTDDDLDRVLEGIVGANGKPMAPLIEGTNKFGTTSVMKSFWGIMHTDLRSSMKALASFVRTSNYPSQDAVLTDEFCSTDEIRWIATTEATKTTAADPVYRLKVVAGNAYGVVPVTEVSNEMIIKPLGSGDDPLNQRQTMGWKAKLGGVILDDSWVRILNVTKK